VTIAVMNAIKVLHQDSMEMDEIKII